MASLRKNNLDYLKTLAILSVITMHIFDKLIASYNMIPPTTWAASNYIESTLRMAVPIFFMINGMLLLKKDEGEKAVVFYKKKFPRLLISYVIFTFISLEISSHWFGAPYTSEDFWSKLIHFTGFYHLWFVKTLMAIYLLVPAMRLMIRFIKRADTYYLMDAFIVIWFGASILAPFLTFQFNLPEVTFSSPFVTWILPYLGYFVLGYYLECRIKPIIQRKGRVLMGCFASLLCGILFTSYLTQTHLNVETNALNPYVYYPYSLNIFLTSVSVTTIFLLLDHVFKESKVIRFFAEESLIIYLAHPIIIGCLEFDYNLTVFTNNPLLGAVKMTAITIALSTAIAICWKVIKHLFNPLLAKITKLFSETASQTSKKVLND